MLINTTTSVYDICILFVHSMSIMIRMAADNTINIMHGQATVNGPSIRNLIYQKCNSCVPHFLF